VSACLAVCPALDSVTEFAGGTMENTIKVVS